MGPGMVVGVNPVVWAAAAVATPVAALLGVRWLYCLLGWPSLCYLHIIVLFSLGQVVGGVHC